MERRSPWRRVGLALAMAGASLLQCSRATSLLPSALPATRPPDFAFRYSRSGGMLDDSEVIECDALRCAWQRHLNGQGSSDTRTPSAAQLDMVYAAFRDARFDRMRPERHELVYDASASAVTLRVQGREQTLGEGARESVARGDARRFGAVVDTIRALSRTLFPVAPSGTPLRPSNPAAPSGPSPQPGS